SCACVRGLRPILADERRVDKSSAFARDFPTVVDEVEAMKRERLSMVDFCSIQARDAALNHNETVAAFALALLRTLKSRDPQSVERVDEKHVVYAALLHDLGKHAIEVDRLNRPSLSGEELNELRADMRAATLQVLTTLGATNLVQTIEGLYDFEK